MSIQLHTGDCVDIMQTHLAKETIDLTITSPPYDNMRAYQGYTFDFEGIAQELLRVTKQGGIVVWVVADQTVDGDETGTSFQQALYFKEIGFKLFDTMIYMKQPRGAIGSRKAYWNVFEYMFVLSKGHPKTICLLKDRKNKEARSKNTGTKRYKDGTLKSHKRGGYGIYGRRTNVWQYTVGSGLSTKDKLAHQHPAIFPEQLALDHILSWSKTGDLILDPMCGSGTVGKMAIQNGRNFIGIDISSEYIEITKERLKEFQMLLF